MSSDTPRHGETENELAPLPVAIRRRLRLVASGVLVGVPGGAVGIGLALLGGRSLTAALALVFALGAVFLGFGVLGWSGSIFAGRGIESMQRYMETGTDWTERKSRRAMARLVGVGLGVMVCVSVIETLLA
jgi:hypothetical protein